MPNNTLFGRLQHWLAQRTLYRALLLLNVLAAVAVTAATFHTEGGDHYTYLGYADGLLHGRYSYWYFFPDYIPDTFRNPGYPLFLFLLKALGASEGGIRLVQVGLYAVTIALMVRLLARYEASWLLRNLFLLLLLPNVQLVYFAAVIFPEILVAFLLAVYGWVVIVWPPNTWRRTLALALIAGLIFQTRPIFILFPGIQLLLDLWHTRPKAAFSWLQAIVMLGLFGATMLPYTYWNYRHHGVLKPTSLEGGAGVMQVGFWALRMPGYRESRYWGNLMGDEIVSFADPVAVPGYIAAFNREWDAIDNACRPLLTARDKHDVPLMRRDHPRLFPTYSSAYTLHREKLLMQANLANIRREPGYYLKTRLYTLVRLWVTGIQKSAWRAAASSQAKIAVLYPVLVSGFTFLLALVSIGWVLLKRPAVDAIGWRFALALIAYFGLVHLPFAIQARYTVPVRPWLLFAIAIAVGTWLKRRSAVATA